MMLKNNEISDKELAKVSAGANKFGGLNECDGVIVNIIRNSSLKNYGIYTVELTNGNTIEAYEYSHFLGINVGDKVGVQIITEHHSVRYSIKQVYR